MPVRGADADGGADAAVAEAPVLDYLRRAMIAHRSGLPAPQLLGQRGN